MPDFGNEQNSFHYRVVWRMVDDGGTGACDMTQGRRKAAMTTGPCAHREPSSGKTKI